MVFIPLPHPPGGFRPPGPRRGHSRDHDGTIPDAEFHLIRQSGLFNQRFRQANTAGIADANQAGLHQRTSSQVVRDYILITCGGPVNRMSG